MNILSNYRELFLLVGFAYFINFISLSQGEKMEGPTSLKIPVLSKVEKNGKVKSGIQQGRAVEDDAAEADTPKDDADTPKDDTDTPKDDTDTPKDDTAEADTPKDDTAEADTPKDDADTPKDDADTPKDDTAEADTPKDDAAEGDAPESDVPEAAEDQGTPHHSVGITFTEEGEDDVGYEKVIDNVKKANVMQRLHENKQYHKDLNKLVVGKANEAVIEDEPVVEEGPPPSHVIALEFKEDDDDLGYEKILDQAKNEAVKQRNKENNDYRAGMGNGMFKSGAKTLYEPRLDELPKRPALTYLQELTREFEKKNMKEIQRHKNHRILISILKRQGKY